MGIITLAIQWFSLFWLAMMGTFALTTQLRCMIHDRHYIVGKDDVLTALCIIYLLANGLPPLGI